MQLDINVLPVAIGVCTYVLFWALSKFVASSPRRERKEEGGVHCPGKGAQGESVADDVVLASALEDAERPLEPLEEPETEPNLETRAAAPSLEKKPDSRRGAGAISLLLAAAFVAAALYFGESGIQPGLEPPAPPLELPRREQGLEPPAPPPEPPRREQGQPSVPAAALQPVPAAPVPAALEPAPAAGAPGAETSEEAEVKPEETALAPCSDFAAELPAERGMALQDDSVTPNNPLTVKLTRQTVGDDQPDYIRSAYYGTLMVGSPAKPFTVVFDTGSGHLVLPSTYCSSPTCKAHRRYSRRASETAADVNFDGAAVTPGEPRDQMEVEFGTGQVTGVLVEDVICVGEPENPVGGPSGNESGALALQDSGNCVKLRMIAATSLSADPFESFQFDGVLGLGLDGLSEGPAFNFMNVMLNGLEQSGRGLRSTFGVFLAENEEEDSEIALGGWTQNHLAEDLSWGPVHDPELGHWIVHVRGIRVNDVPLSFCQGGCNAAVDTGTSLLAVPTSAFTEMFQGLRHTAPKAGHCLGFGPLLHIDLDHFTVTLGPRDYARLAGVKPQSQKRARLVEQGSRAQRKFARDRQDVRCVPTLMTIDMPEPLGPDLIILGEPVLRKYYTVFDTRRKWVGFGRARHQQAPTREDLLMQAPELDRSAGLPGSSRRSPTMFDVFRWRKALR